MGLGAGTLITKSVRLERLLDSGGMGSIWVADHLTLNAKVAVKLVLEALQQDHGARARLAFEAQAAARIKSPHVAQVFDSGLTDQGLPFIVMELLEGEDLGQYIARRGRLDLREVAHVVSQTCKALGAAHAAGIIHRDIKPSNVFLTRHEEEVFVKVLDFGIAKQVGDLGANVTSTGVMVGTPWYMSPEQIVSPREIDFRSDLWSLAVAAYYAVTGDIPFTGETLGAICVAISHGRYRPPSSLRPELPSAVDAWFARAFIPDPPQRFGSAREMATSFALAAGTTNGAIVMSAPSEGSHVVRHAPLTPYDQSAPTLANQPAPGVLGAYQETLGATSTLDPPPRARTPLVRAMGIGLVVVTGVALGATLWRAPSLRAPSPTTTPASAAPLPSAAPSLAAPDAAPIAPPTAPTPLATTPTASAVPAGSARTTAIPAPTSPPHADAGRTVKSGTVSPPPVHAPAPRGTQVDRGF